jgi:hypothetical protein
MTQTLCLQIVGCCRWFPFPVLAHARQIVQALEPGGSPQGTDEPAERYDHHDAFHA